VAIYGLGAIKDERLHDMFVKGLVEFSRPNENADEWFNIFVIHQNRTAHGKKNYIPGKIEKKKTNFYSPPAPNFNFLVYFHRGFLAQFY